MAKGIPRKYAIYAIRQLLEGKFWEDRVCCLLSENAYHKLLVTLYRIAITPPHKLFLIDQQGQTKDTMAFKLCDAIYCSAGSLFLSKCISSGHPAQYSDSIQYTYPCRGPIVVDATGAQFDLFDLPIGISYTPRVQRASIQEAYQAEVQALKNLDDILLITQGEEDWNFNTANLYSPKDFDSPSHHRVTWPLGRVTPDMTTAYGADAKYWVKYVMLVEGVPVEFRCFAHPALDGAAYKTSSELPTVPPPLIATPTHHQAALQKHPAEQFSPSPSPLLSKGAVTTI